MATQTPFDDRHSYEYPENPSQQLIPPEFPDHTCLSKRTQSCINLSKERKLFLVLISVLGFTLLLSWRCSNSGMNSWGPGMVYVSRTTQTDEYGNTWQESTVEVNKIQVSYYHNVGINQTGSTQAIVFFHSGGSDGTEGIAMFGSIAQNQKFFFPSARGCGKTTRRPPFSTTQMVLDAEGLLPALVDVNKVKVLLIGHSMGATIAPRVAKENSSYVSGLVLEDPGWLRREGEDESKNRPGYQPRGGDSLSNESVEKISVPTIIMTAEFGDGVPEVIDDALSTYKNGTKVYFAGAGHCIHCDFLPKYLEVVKKFLN